MTRALIALGSNLGDREANLRRALAHLEAEGAARVVAVSAFVETDPVGPPQPRYLNGAAVVETPLGPRALLAALQRAEAAAGRRPGGVRWGPREADLDLLLHGDAVVDEPGLVVPHPRMAERRFVLGPAAEVAREMRHPRLGRTVGELLEDLP
jgi:2-amino-4-hydroxy-6-hydroxymethyldihydropteridine diphosphokinase